MKMMASAGHRTINSRLTTSKSNKKTSVARNFREVVRPVFPSLSAQTECADGIHLLMSAKLRTIVNQMEREQFFSSFLVKWTVSLWPIQHCIPFYLNLKWCWGMQTRGSGTQYWYRAQPAPQAHPCKHQYLPGKGGELTKAMSPGGWVSSAMTKLCDKLWSTTLGSVVLNVPSYRGLQTFTVTVYSSADTCVFWICLF